MANLEETESVGAHGGGIYSSDPAVRAAELALRASFTDQDAVIIAGGLAELHRDVTATHKVTIHGEGSTHQYTSTVTYDGVNTDTADLLDRDV